MGRASRPTRRLAAAQVQPSDVVLIRYPSVPNSRWMLVDYVVGYGAPHIWSGRWAFGKDAGAWVIQVTHTDDVTYTVKHPLDAKLDAERLEV